MFRNYFFSGRSFDIYIHDYDFFNEEKAQPDETIDENPYQTFNSIIKLIQYMDQECNTKYQITKKAKELIFISLVRFCSRFLWKYRNNDQFF